MLSAKVMHRGSSANASLLPMQNRTFGIQFERECHNFCVNDIFTEQHREGILNRTPRKRQFQFLVDLDDLVENF